MVYKEKLGQTRVSRSREKIKEPTSQKERMFQVQLQYTDKWPTVSWNQLTTGPFLLTPAVIHKKTPVSHTTGCSSKWHFPKLL